MDRGRECLRRQTSSAWRMIPDDLGDLGRNKVGDFRCDKFIKAHEN